MAIDRLDQDPPRVRPDAILKGLSRKHPIFHSEADFQHALAWATQSEHPSCSTNQAAEDRTRYDFVKDFVRLKRVVESCPATSAMASANERSVYTQRADMRVGAAGNAFRPGTDRVPAVLLVINDGVRQRTETTERAPPGRLLRMVDHMQVNILTIGTRGDVEPYLALGAGLARRGHRVVVQTLAEFDDAVRAAGFEHRPIRGEFLADVRTDGVDAPGSFARLGAYRRMAAEALEDEWAGAAGADLLVFNPAAWGGPHIAERLAIPAFAAFPTPLYTPTREFSSPFVPLRSLGPLNKLSHGAVARLGPVALRKPLARWRRAVLGLENGLARRFPILYGFSEHVVRRPRDWPDDAHVTGYWFRDAEEGWQPSESLVTFLADGPPPVYIGFGSMVPQRQAVLTAAVLDAVRRIGRRAVIATGWGGLRPDAAGPGVHVVGSLPHDWLFPQVAAIVHHGGAGTTAAGLRAGRPTVVCPFITDQFFWGRRVAELGVGPRPIPQRKLTADRLANALDTACSDAVISARAAELGKLIRAEKGVDAAVDRIIGSIA